MPTTIRIVGEIMDGIHQKAYYTTAIDINPPPCLHQGFQKMPPKQRMCF